MKKLTLLLIIILFVSHYASAQINWGKYSQTYPSILQDDDSKIGIVTNIEERNDDFWSVTNINKLEKKVFDDSSFQKADSTEFTFVATFSYTPAYFFIKNINRNNAADFEYRVSRDGHGVITPWSDFKQFNTPGFGAGKGEISEMAYIGGFKVDLGHQLIVDVRKKNSDKLLSTAVVSWISISPVVSNIFNADHLNDFFNYLTHSWLNNGKKQWQPATIKSRPTMRSTENNLIFTLEASISDNEQIQYEVLKDGKVYIPWKSNDFDNNFIWLKNLPHGNYRLRIKYTVQPDHITNYDFIVKPAWYQTTLTKFIAGSLLAAFFALIILVMILLNQRKKAASELAKKAKIQMELQVIRAQLNPHFIFNALTSIQGLINKNNIEGANTYLAEFASLLRNTLIHHEQEQIPLLEEIRILETYLKLEQLRFNFQYKIHVQQEINISETEIPSLLLQPLLENAIKHGIADVKEAGAIDLSFIKKNNNFIAIIKDNGAGFNILPSNSGYGLKLIRNRIELLNNILIDTEIKIKINSDNLTGTEVILTFINWLDEN